MALRPIRQFFRPRTKHRKRRFGGPSEPILAPALKVNPNGNDLTWASGGKVSIPSSGKKGRRPLAVGAARMCHHYNICGKMMWGTAEFRLVELARFCNASGLLALARLRARVTTAGDCK